MKFTTSWDDGYHLDLRVAKTLQQYGTTGTFYVCPMPQHHQQMLTEEQIKELSMHFEIGAHTLTHPRLSSVSKEQAVQEIAGSKQWIETITGKPCEMFCYPKGDKDIEIASLVREAGFKGARTVEGFQFTMSDPFLMPTSLQLYPFPFRRKWTQWWHVLDPLGRLRYHWNDIQRIKVPISKWWNWLSLAEYMFEYSVETNQPFFHLWGHSEELQRYNLWNDLEKFLAKVQATPGIDHVTNSQLLK